MATETKLRQLADKDCPVYYFYSSERYPVSYTHLTLPTNSLV